MKSRNWLRKISVKETQNRADYEQTKRLSEDEIRELWEILKKRKITRLLK